MKTKGLFPYQTNAVAPKPRVLQAIEPNAKVPPQATDLEQSILGALMLEKDALTDVIDILKPESFYEEVHQEIYRAIIQLFNNAEPIDLRTVVNQLRKNGQLEFVGGSYYLASLTTQVSSAANVEFHARAVVEYAIKRALIAIATTVHKNAYEDTMDVFTLLDQAEQALFEITETNIRKNYAEMRSLLGEAFKELEAKRTHKDGLTGTPSGFTALDRLTSGWQKADLIIVAARPGMGKDRKSVV